MKRRNLLLGAGALAIGGTWALRPSDNSRPHSVYFASLQDTLRQAGLMRPCAVIDLDRLDHNIDVSTRALAKAGKQLRIVEKSLPSPELLSYIRERSGSKRLMSFHLPFLIADTQNMPDADILLGKPMPVAAAAEFYAAVRGPFKAEQQLQWLIDTPERLKQYQELAVGLGLRMNINIELDVGLHRGGVTSTEMMSEMLAIISAHPEQLRFSGFMGYDPFVVMLPAVLGSPEQQLDKVMAIYQSHVDLVKRKFPNLWRDDLTLNTAGSPTYTLHLGERLSTELAIGTGLLKPSHYDIATLAEHQAAVFISTPVLKTTGPVQLPGLGRASQLFSAWDANQRESLFLYGGQWLADPESPQGLQLNGLYGRSSNQELMNISPHAGVKVDDLVFLRPQQTEAVLLQFGDLIAVRGNKVIAQWPTLKG